MYGSMVDIQSAVAEIRRGKKLETTGQKYNIRICYTQGGHNKAMHTSRQHGVAR